MVVSIYQIRNAEKLWTLFHATFIYNIIDVFFLRPIKDSLYLCFLASFEDSVATLTLLVNCILRDKLLSVSISFESCLLST